MRCLKWEILSTLGEIWKKKTPQSLNIRVSKQMKWRISSKTNVFTNQTVFIHICYPTIWIYPNDSFRIKCNSRPYNSFISLNNWYDDNSCHTLSIVTVNPWEWEREKEGARYIRDNAYPKPHPNPSLLSSTLFWEFCLARNMQCTPKTKSHNALQYSSAQNTQCVQNIWHKAVMSLSVW